MTLVYKYFTLVGFCFLIIVGVTFAFFPLYSFKGFEKALEGVLLLSSIGLGFYGACLSVLASVFNTRAVKEIMADKDYRDEFIVLSLSTLSISFITVLTTIVYQVLLENESFSDTTLNIVNAFWLGITIVFLMLNVLFVLVSFMIFLSNKD